MVTVDQLDYNINRGFLNGTIEFYSAEITEDGLKRKGELKKKELFYLGSIGFNLFMSFFLWHLNFRPVAYVNCHFYWNKEWYSITATQIIVFLLFMFGIFFAIIMYCKTCSRTSRARYSEEILCRSERNSERISSGAVQCYSIYESRDRPPSYSEACGAPPLYASPFNRVSMLEAPPVYPDSPKPCDRTIHQTNQAYSASSHI